ncbi:three component ABC system middle component [Bradyrhizobium sp. 195]|uniref:three component ABC system middle component n=1 Tax=Bradyrhizobium sp. 195 TaxID=2782662 RepID=UPI002097284A|nr:three component ABC system middle component [Bradyrhizobium sp. 195]
MQKRFFPPNLFNPAFCGLVLFRALAGFHAEDDKGMPFSLSLLVLPLCLQQSSRETLQRANRSYFLKVVADHPELLVGFGKRCTDVLPFTLEGLGLPDALRCGNGESGWATGSEFRWSAQNHQWQR